MASLVGPVERAVPDAAPDLLRSLGAGEAWCGAMSMPPMVPTDPGMVVIGCGSGPWHPRGVEEAVLEVTTGGDAELLALISAQEAEVMRRYGVDDAGPGLSPETPCLIARLAGRPVGCVALGRLGEGVGEVKRMYVDPAVRGHRIGRLLLSAVEELAASRGDRLLRLEAGTRQPEALRLYDGAGWNRIECYGYFKDDPTTICFEKVIHG